MNDVQRLFHDATRGIRSAEFAADHGLDFHVVWAAQQGIINPEIQSFATIVRLAEALRISPVEMFKAYSSDLAAARKSLSKNKKPRRSNLQEIRR